MTDPIDGLERYLEDQTNVPHLLVLILAFALVIALSHGFLAAGRYAIRKRKKTILLALAALFGLASILWADSRFGALVLLLVLAYAARKPIKRLLTRRRTTEAE